MELNQYIINVFPSGLRYNDAAQLCLHLYCTVEDIPEQFHTQCNKDNLANMFASLAKSGFIKDDGQMWSTLYGANFHAVDEKGHWIEVIASIFKIGSTVNMQVRDHLAQILNTHLNGDAAKSRT